MRYPWILLGVLSTAAALAVVAGTAGDAGLIVLGDVRFPHEQHSREMELDCVICHHETTAKRLDIPHEEYFPDFWGNCKSCHENHVEAASIQPCGSCHHDSPADVADETLSAKVVIHRSCWTCHEVGTGRTASQSCKTCHTRKDRALAAGD